MATARQAAASTGLPGDLEHRDDTNSFTNPKIGGHPVFPGAVPPSEAVVCLRCGKPLSLVAQVNSHDMTAIQHNIIEPGAATT